MLLTGCAGRGYSYNILVWHTCAYTHTNTLSCSAVRPLAEALNDDLVAGLHESLKQQLLPGPGSSLRPHYLWCSLNSGASRQQSVQPSHAPPASPDLPASSAPHPFSFFFFTTTSTLIIADGTFMCAFDEKLQDAKTQRLLEGKKKKSALHAGIVIG